jgi:hypothetical protein
MGIELGNKTLRMLEVILRLHYWDVSLDNSSETLANYAI